VTPAILIDIGVDDLDRAVGLSRKLLGVKVRRRARRFSGSK
jgi:hypothetical protein